MNRQLYHLCELETAIQLMLRNKDHIIDHPIFEQYTNVLYKLASSKRPPKQVKRLSGPAKKFLGESVIDVMKTYNVLKEFDFQSMAASAGQHLQNFGQSAGNVMQNIPSNMGNAITGAQNYMSANPQAMHGAAIGAGIGAIGTLGAWGIQRMKLRKARQDCQNLPKNQIYQCQQNVDNQIKQLRNKALLGGVAATALGGAAGHMVGQGFDYNAQQAATQKQVDAAQTATGQVKEKVQQVAANANKAAGNMMHQAGHAITNAGHAVGGAIQQGAQNVSNWVYGGKK